VRKTCNWRLEVTFITEEKWKKVKKVRNKRNLNGIFAFVFSFSIKIPPKEPP